MLQELTFVDSVLLITVSTLAAVRGKFSCRNTPKFTTRHQLGRANPSPPLAYCDCPRAARRESASALAPAENQRTARGGTRLVSQLCFGHTHRELAVENG